MITTKILKSFTAEHIERKDTDKTDESALQEWTKMTTLINEAQKKFTHELTKNELFSHPAESNDDALNKAFSTWCYLVSDAKEAILETSDEARSLIQTQTEHKEAKSRWERAVQLRELSKAPEKFIADHEAKIAEYKQNLKSQFELPIKSAQARFIQKDMAASKSKHSSAVMKQGRIQSFAKWSALVCNAENQLKQDDLRASLLSIYNAPRRKFLESMRSELELYMEHSVEFTLSPLVPKRC